MSNYTVGQKLWFVPSDLRSGKPHEIAITRIGRKWLQTDCEQYRLDIVTLRADGGNYSPPGRAYLSREDYESSLALYHAWVEFHDKVSERRWRTPTGVTIERIREASRILFGEPTDNQ